MINSQEVQEAQEIKEGQKGNYQESFIKISKKLFTDETLKKLSSDAKLLFSLLKERENLSKKNNWIDKSGKIYIIFTNKSMQDYLNCSDKKASKILKELVEMKLIFVKKQGQGKPNIIYINSLETNKLRPQKRTNYVSKIVKITSLETKKLRCNKTDISKTDISKTDIDVVDSNRDINIKQLEKIINKKLNNKQQQKLILNLKELKISFEELILKVKESKYLKGEIREIDLGWLVNKNTLLKIKNDNYKDKDKIQIHEHKNFTNTKINKNNSFHNFKSSLGERFKSEEDFMKYIDKIKG